MKLFVFFTMFLSLSAWSSNQNIDWTKLQWQKTLSKDGVDMYFTKDKVADSGVKAYKFIFDVKQNFGKVLGYLENQENVTKWAVNLDEAKTLEKNPRKSVVYRKFKKIWPFKLRDLVMQMTPAFNQQEKYIQLNLKSIEHPLAPEVPEGAHRAQMLGGYFRVTATDRESTRIEVVNHVDFGGFVPALALEYRQKQDMMKNFVLLKSQLENQTLPIEEKYQKLFWLLFP